VLRHPDLNIARVGHRVKLGGHGVEGGRIRARWLRSVDNLPWFAARASSLSLWDNTRAASEGRPELVLAATPNQRFVNRQAALLADPDAHPALLKAVDAVIDGL
jgi:predicted ABC-type ATPase